jgi:hypothetical protein
MHGRLAGLVLAAAGLAVTAGAAHAQDTTKAPEEHFLSDSAIGLQVTSQPHRPRLPLELGAAFLGPGKLSGGIHLPTGAVWRPALWIFGTARTSVQSFDNGAARTSEWANRVDLYANLRLSGTERFLFGMRPLDATGGVGYTFNNGGNWQNTFNRTVTSAFFEGDLGEIFPFLDPSDRGAVDIGFAVGRQDLAFQRGVMINDNLDAVGMTRNSLRPFGMSNLRITTVFAWNHVHRRGVLDPSAKLLGVFTESDFSGTTIDIDGAFVSADPATGTAFYGGVSAVQTLGRFSTTFRAVTSLPVGDPTPIATRGLLLEGQLSWTPHRTENLAYVNAFAAIGTYTSAARQPLAGGPLEGLGILFSAPGIGRYGSALDDRAAHVVGASGGYQMFFDHTRRQLVLELAGRKDTNGSDTGAGGIGARLEQAVGRRFVVRLDGFGVAQQVLGVRLGARLETMMKM